MIDVIERKAYEIFVGGSRRGIVLSIPDDGNLLSGKKRYEAWTPWYVEPIKDFPTCEEAKAAVVNGPPQVHDIKPGPRYK